MVQDAVIVGGSLSGLMYGIILRDLGYNVRILERNQETLLAQAGAGLQVGPDIERLMHEYGCDGRPYWIDNPRADVVDKDGNTLTTLEPGVKATGWDVLYFRLRARFDGLKTPYYETDLENLEGTGMYLYDHRAEGITVVDQKVEVRCMTSAGEKTYKADLAIVADGASSRTRSLLLPEAPEREYLGYLALRGTVDLSQSTEVMRSGIDRHCRIHQSFFLSYTIPGKNGSLNPADRVRNWVWYRRLPAESDEYKSLTTTNAGHSGRLALSRGEMQESVWQRQKNLASQSLDRECAELLHRTSQPFVQVITSLLTGKAVFHDGKVLLVGDAFATLRPLSGQGTNQGAKGALALREVLRGDGMTLQEWEALCVETAEKATLFGLGRERQAQLSE